MPSRPSISVIMPVFNKRPYIRRSVESVLGQEEENWELIIVDDGSTDDSIAEVPRDDRIRIFTQENQGPSAARNFGIRQSRGPLVTFLDADDRYYPGKLKTEIRSIGLDKSAEWMVSGYHKVRDGKKEHVPFRDINGTPINSGPKVYTDAINQLTIKGWPSNGICATRALIDRTGAFSEDLRCLEITDFIYKLALAAPQVLISPDPVYEVIDVPGSTFKHTENRLAGAKVFAERLAKYASHHPTRAALLKSRSKELLFSYASGLNTKGKKIQALKNLVVSGCFENSARWWKLFFKVILP